MARGATPSTHALRQGSSCLWGGRDYGKGSGMSTTITIGKAGRIVVPKALRDRLHLREGSRLRVAVVEDRLEFTPEEDEVKIERRHGLPVITGWKGFNAAKAVNEMREDYMDRLAGKHRK